MQSGYRYAQTDRPHRNGEQGGNKAVCTDKIILFRWTECVNKNCWGFSTPYITVFYERMHSPGWDLNERINAHVRTWSKIRRTGQGTLQILFVPVHTEHACSGPIKTVNVAWMHVKSRLQATHEHQVNGISSQSRPLTCDPIENQTTQSLQWLGPLEHLVLTLEY